MDNSEQNRLVSPQLMAELGVTIVGHELGGKSARIRAGLVVFVSGRRFNRWRFSLGAGRGQDDAVAMVIVQAKPPVRALRSSAIIVMACALAALGWLVKNAINLYRVTAAPLSRLRLHVHPENRQLWSRLWLSSQAFQAP